MAFKRARARILERSTTAGSGPWVLAGAADGSYNTFSSFLANADTCYGSVVEPGVAFATGVLTYGSSGNIITLTDVEEAHGTFGSGTKEIMAGPLASSNMLREDIAGSIVTGGTSTAYTVSSHRGYDTLAHLDGAIIAFTPHTANGATVTLNVDALGAKPLRLAPNVELQSSTLIAGTPYMALYNNTDGAFYLHALSAGNSYGVPLGGGMDYWGQTTPSSAFAFPFGQAISRITYSSLFSLIGTQFGSGDGTSTFNLPDKRGRVSAALDNLGGGARANRLTATTITSAGGAGGLGVGDNGGSQTNTLQTSNLPPYTPSGSVTGTASVSSAGGYASFTGNVNVQAGGNPIPIVSGNSTVNSSGSISATFSGSAQGGSSVPVNIVMPTICCNYIMRVI